MRTVIWLGVVTILGQVLGASVAVHAQGRDLSRIRVLAVAPFGDNDPLTRAATEAGAARLSELLKGGRFQIIESSRVGEETKRLGVTATALVSPSQAIALGAQVGADAILTGRVVQVSRDKGLPPATQEVRVAVDVRTLEVKTRLKLFEEEISCSVFGGSLESAMDCVAREVVARLAGS
jgi:hypothetical protein